MIAEMKIMAELRLRHPAWLAEAVATASGHRLEDVAHRMQLVIDWSRRNIEQGSGGPFAAAIFESASHRLIAAGVNVVVSNGCSMAHAEMMAISAAQQQLQNHDLGAADIPAMELVSSCEPCAMCFGALPWSGIRRLVCGATAADATAIGFDEGPRHPERQQQLEQRSIQVITEVHRDQAAAVLNEYAGKEGMIYNGRSVQ